jgi:hypothetical protein
VREKEKREKKQNKTKDPSPLTPPLLPLPQLTQPPALTAHINLMRTLGALLKRLYLRHFGEDLESRCV